MLTGIRYSTWQQIPKLPLPQLPNEAGEKDGIFRLNYKLASQVDHAIESIIQCTKCNTKLHDRSCSCNKQKAEGEEIVNQLNTTREILDKLKQTPFRQSRNAYGLGAGLFGGIKLVEMIPAVIEFIASGGFFASAASVGLFMLPIAAAGFVYYRGWKEEQEINEDLEADLTHLRVSLYLNYAEYVRLSANTQSTELKAESKVEKEKVNLVVTHEVNNKSPEELAALSINKLELQSVLPFKPESKAVAASPNFNSNQLASGNTENKLNLSPTFFNPSKGYKEKRGIKGNSFSHFVVPSLSTLGAFSVLIYAGILAGGPVTWGMAIFVSLCVGAYFAYKRYKQLTYKCRFESEMSKLSKINTALNAKIHKLKDEKSLQQAQEIEQLKNPGKPALRAA